MQDEIREQLLANQQMMEDNMGWDAKLSQVYSLQNKVFAVSIQ